MLSMTSNSAATTGPVSSLGGGKFSCDHMAQTALSVDGPFPGFYDGPGRWPTRESITLHSGSSPHHTGSHAARGEHAAALATERGHLHNAVSLGCAPPHGTAPPCAPPGAGSGGCPSTPTAVPAAADNVACVFQTVTSALRFYSPAAQPAMNGCMSWNP
jgi:hypothetical protein